VVALANHLPARHKLQGLDEKHVLKLAATGLVPNDIVHRRKQPYRAPDALCFVAPDAPAYVSEMLGEASVAQAQVFDPRLVTQLLHKCRAHAHSQQLSNTDNMALVAVLSTQLLHTQFVQACPNRIAPVPLVTDVDRTRCTEPPHD
jgi:asparagine synthase (glutamine-hydrolysing)